MGTTYINFSVVSSDGSIISNWNYTNESEIPHVESTICQYFGTVANFTPQNEQPKEIVFNSFQYISSKQSSNYESADDLNPENETKFYKGVIDKLNEL